MTKTVLLVVLCCLLCKSSLAQKLRLMSYNVRNAKGIDNKTDYDRTAAVIKNSNADIVALQELDSVTKRNGGEDALKILAGKTGLFSVYGAAIPYQGGKYGVGILSKRRPLKFHSIPLPGKEEERVLLVAEFKKYVIFCTHLSLTDADRMRSVAIINEKAAKYKKPIYLLGDLNAEPTSKFVVELKKEWTLLSGEEPTFPATAPKKCIDYILVRNNRKAKVISSAVLDEPLTSDHRPVVVDVGRE